MPICSDSATVVTPSVLFGVLSSSGIWSTVVGVKVGMSRSTTVIFDRLLAPTASRIVGAGLLAGWPTGSGSTRRSYLRDSVVGRGPGLAVPPGVVPAALHSAGQL